MEVKIQLESDAQRQDLFGPGDSHLRYLRDALKVKISARNGTVLVSGEASGVRRVAHSLKSNGADFGAATFSHLCKDLENMGKSGKLDGAQELAAQIMTEYERVKSALALVRQEGKIVGA